jgi:hypothetical protein
MSVLADDSSISTTTPAVDTNASATSTSPTTLTLGFSTSVSDPTGDNPLPVTATFSEPVTGFQANSLNIALGHVTNFVQVSPSLYTFNVAIDAPQGSVSIDSNDPNVKDSYGNIVLAAPQLHVVYDSSLPNNTASSTGGGSTGSTTSSTTTPPWIAFLTGPADGSIISTSTATFTFDHDASSTISCSFGSVTTVYGCGSPQTFTDLVNGIYPFSIFANYMGMTASSSRTFTVDLTAASSTTATSTDTTATSTVTTTPSSPSSSNNDTVIGGTYNGGSSIYPYAFSSSNGSSRNGNIVTTTTINPTPSYQIENTLPQNGNTSDDSFSSTDSGQLALNSTEPTPSTVSDSTSTLDSMMTDASTTLATSTQAAAAGLSGISPLTLWGSIIALIIVVGGLIWYTSRRTSQ